HLSRPARVGAYVFLCTAVGLALVLPIATFVWWTVQGVTAGNTMLSIFPHMTRSILISLGAAALIALAALPIAILSVRFRGRRVRVLESIAWTAYSLPHIAVGLAFLVVGVGILRPIYQR